MQIVITDGYTLNPGDLSWEPFEKLGDVKYYDRTPGNEVESDAVKLLLLSPIKLLLLLKLSTQLQSLN